METVPSTKLFVWNFSNSSWNPADDSDTYRSSGTASYMLYFRGSSSETTTSNKAYFKAAEGNVYAAPCVGIRYIDGSTSTSGSLYGFFTSFVVTNATNGAGSTTDVAYIEFQDSTMSEAVRYTLHLNSTNITRYGHETTTLSDGTATNWGHYQYETVPLGNRSATYWSRISIYDSTWTDCTTVRCAVYLAQTKNPAIEIPSYVTTGLSTDSAARYLLPVSDTSASFTVNDTYYPVSEFNYSSGDMSTTGTPPSVKVTQSSIIFSIKFPLALIGEIPVWSFGYITSYADNSMGIEYEYVDGADNWQAVISDSEKVTINPVFDSSKALINGGGDFNSSVELTESSTGQNLNAYKLLQYFYSSEYNGIRSSRDHTMTLDTLFSNPSGDSSTIMARMEAAVKARKPGLVICCRIFRIFNNNTYTDTEPSSTSFNTVKNSYFTTLTRSSNILVEGCSFSDMYVTDSSGNTVGSFPYFYNRNGSLMNVTSAGYYGGDGKLHRIQIC